MIERTYRISDVVNDEFLRFPLTLLANPKYKEMSLEAKFIYSLLLNRLTLSQKNGWVNQDNEVYLIYTREEAANMLNISYKKTIAAFRELIGKGLLYEKRQGRGYPNLLYVLKTELSDTEATKFSKEYCQTTDDTAAEKPNASHDLQICSNDISRPVKTTVRDMTKLDILNCQHNMSKTVDTEDSELSIRHPKNIQNIKNNISYSDNKQSICLSHESNEQSDADNKFLENIFEQCELEIFKPNIRTMIRSVIERLYYSKIVKVGNAQIPQAKVRDYLTKLDAGIVIAAIENMRANEKQITNPTAYLMSTLFNSIFEKDISLFLNLPPQYLKDEDFYMPTKYFEEEVKNDAPK